MSHFVVYVVLPKETPEDPAIIDQELTRLMAPFEEQLDVAPYPVEMSDEDLGYMKTSYHTEDLNELCAHVTDWCGGEEARVEDGKLVYTSTRNPQPHWDWYQIGGRFEGFISQTQSEADQADLLIRAGKYAEANAFYETLDERESPDIVRLQDVPELRTPFALLTPDGKWHEKARMGWFGATHLKHSPRYRKVLAAIEKRTKQCGGKLPEDEISAALENERAAAYDEMQQAAEAEWASGFNQLIRPYRETNNLMVVVDAHI